MKLVFTVVYISGVVIDYPLNSASEGRLLIDRLSMEESPLFEARCHFFSLLVNVAQIASVAIREI